MPSYNMQEMKYDMQTIKRKPPFDMDDMRRIQDAVGVVGDERRLSFTQKFHSNSHQPSQNSSQILMNRLKKSLNRPLT